MTNLSNYDVYIVEKDRQYLKGYRGVFGISWTSSYNDAWCSLSYMIAKQVADRFGGHILCFNQITQDIREAI